MRVATLASETDFEGWRLAARAFRLDGVTPGEARFRVAGVDAQEGLFDAPAVPGAPSTPAQHEQHDQDDADELDQQRRPQLGEHLRRRTDPAVLDSVEVQ